MPHNKIPAGGAATPAPRRGSSRMAAALPPRSEPDPLAAALLNSLAMVAAIVTSAASRVPYCAAREMAKLSPAEAAGIAAAARGVLPARSAVVRLGAAVSAIVAARIELALTGAETQAEDAGGAPGPLTPHAALALAFLILLPLLTAALFLILEPSKGTNRAH